MEDGIIADVLLIKGTWADTSGPDAWTKPGGVVDREVMQANGWRVLKHPPAWDGAEHGLISQTLWGHVTGRDDSRDWRNAGKRLADTIEALAGRTALLQRGSKIIPRPLIVMPHSHGNQVAAFALDFMIGRPGWPAPEHQSEEDWMTRRPVFWFAIDPPVRPDMNYIYNSAIGALRLRNGGYHGLAPYPPSCRPSFVLQTRSGAWNWKSWPRWAGGWRPPWDASRIGEHGLTPAVLVDQPGGHSDVLYRPERHLEWWDRQIHRINQVFDGGKPVFPSGSG